MDPLVRQLVENIHAEAGRLVLAAAGGGSQAIAELLEIPGASRTVLEIVVPYSNAAMIKFLGGTPDQFCSPETARAMAMVAFLRARQYDTSDHPRLGVSCTASLATDRPKRGGHRAWLAVQTERFTATSALELEKGRRTRAQEEALVSRLLLDTIARACGLPEALTLELVPSEVLRQDRVDAPQPWQDLLLGRTDAILQSGSAEINSRSPRAIFPGAFNPVHRGHRRMAEIASDMLACPVQFEISVLNVDKPPLDYVQIQNRAGQFAPNEPLWLTRLPTFDEKSRQFPGTTFVVGTDTLARIADPRYYASPAECLHALERISANGCRFLVFGRRIQDRHVSLSGMTLPDPLREICQEVPESRFREDVSSTELRRSAEC